MIRIFVSHSNHDKTLAYNLAKELENHGYKNCFLDFQGIPGGSQWEQEIYTAMRQSSAVLVCTTPEAMKSQWVFAEIIMARYSGIPVIPLIMQDCELPTNLLNTQYIDFTKNPDKGYQELWKALHRHNLKPTNHLWPKEKSPYPGLIPLQEDFNAVFFGREKELELSINYLRPGVLQKKFLSIIGPSGCGKSSFLRAGLIPALKRGVIDGSENWLYIPIFSPGEIPIRNLAEKIWSIKHDLGGVKFIERKIRKKDGLLYLLLELREGKETRIVLSIDQLEELISRTTREEANIFITRLCETINYGDSPLITLTTLRADYVSSCLQFPELALFLQTGSQLLGTMDRSALRRVIQGPAETTGIKFEDGLIEEILDDTRGGDALPLLAHILNLLWFEMKRMNQ